MTGIKRNKITSVNELTSVPTTPIKRLGHVSKDNIVDEIIRGIIHVKSKEMIILT
jgi:hypothetical protein